MKKIALTTVALCALTVGASAGGTPGFSPIATQALTGDIAISGGVWRISEEGSDDKSGILFAGLARAQYFFMPNWSVQFDINGESAYSGEDNKDAVINVAAHIGYHTPAWMIGAMVSKGYNAWDDDTQVTVAVEGVYRMGALQIYGQLGYMAEWGSNETAIYIHKELAYFLNPNLMVSGDLGYSKHEDGSDSAHVVRWGLAVEKKFATAPFGVFARAQGSFRDISYKSGTETEASFRIGFKGYFYSGPLANGLVRRDFNPYNGVNYLPGSF